MRLATGFLTILLLTGTGALVGAQLRGLLVFGHEVRSLQPLQRYHERRVVRVDRGGDLGWANTQGVWACPALNTDIRGLGACKIGVWQDSSL